MPLVLNGDGSIQSLVAGGLPDATVTTADIADANITAAKLSGGQTGSAPVYGCRSFGSFAGATGTAILVRNSTTSRTSTGVYAVAFTTAMEDATYSVNLGFTGTLATGTVANRNCLLMYRDRTANGFNIVCTDPSSGASADSAEVSFQVFR